VCIESILASAELGQHDGPGRQEQLAQPFQLALHLFQLIPNPSQLALDRQRFFDVGRLLQEFRKSIADRAGIANAGLQIEKLIGDILHRNILTRHIAERDRLLQRFTETLIRDTNGNRLIGSVHQIAAKFPNESIDLVEGLAHLKHGEIQRRLIDQLFVWRCNDGVARRRRHSGTRRHRSAIFHCCGGRNRLILIRKRRRFSARSGGTATHPKAAQEQGSQCIQFHDGIFTRPNKMYNTRVQVR